MEVGCIQGWLFIDVSFISMSHPFGFFFRSREEFGVWVEMLMNELKFIPDCLFVENLPVPLVYPFNDPDPHELLKSVKDAIIAEGFA